MIKQFTFVVVFVVNLHLHVQVEVTATPETRLGPMMDRIKAAIQEARELHQQAEIGTDLNAFPEAGAMVSCAKRRLLDLARDRLLERFNMGRIFKDSMEKVRDQYKAAEARGEFQGKDDSEKSAFLYRLAYDELLTLRATFEWGDIQGKTKEEPSAEDKLISSCLGELDTSGKEQLSWAQRDALSGNQEEERELELMGQLDSLERQAIEEDQMGWSLTPEVREKVKKRTQLVMSDLFKNELRQLALSMLSAYMTGSPVGGGVVAAIGASLKAKLVEYLMNVAADIISSATGQPMELKPVAA